MTIRDGLEATVALMMRVVIRAYQLLLAPVLPPACRYLPSCSEYADEAIAVHGPLRGSWLAALRLCRCHPWGGSGYDPVPARLMGQSRP
ncbi:MAG TPA: membrane protein insertion efficiency factor YidD [Stellaceae bacterium]|nr:membrane protein insertion efficiency factor YidD [Stellaceae bacterium]